jgi:hypothetical protein
VLVPVALVCRVPVSVVHVVHVVLVLHSLVPAAVAVLVRMVLVDDVALVRALVPVVVVAAVDVAVVEVVDVVAVLDRDVPAVRSVLVGMIVVCRHVSRMCLLEVPCHLLGIF